jgi:hypothetical protein
MNSSDQSFFEWWPIFAIEEAQQLAAGKLITEVIYYPLCICCPLRFDGYCITSNVYCWRHCLVAAWRSNASFPLKRVSLVFTAKGAQISLRGWVTTHRFPPTIKRLLIIAIHKFGAALARAAGHKNGQVGIHHPHNLNFNALNQSPTLSERLLLRCIVNQQDVSPLGTYFASSDQQRSRRVLVPHAIKHDELELDASNSFTALVRVPDDGLVLSASGGCTLPPKFDGS